MQRGFRGKRLAKIRKNRGLTQAELGQKIGVKMATISNYERGLKEPSIYKLKEMALVLDISSDYLIGLTNDEIPVSRQGYLLLPNNYPLELRQEVEQMRDLIILKHKQIRK